MIGKQTLPLIDTDETDQEIDKTAELPKIAEIGKIGKGQSLTTKDTKEHKGDARAV